MKRHDKPLSTFRRGEIPVSSGVPRFAASAGFIIATLILSWISWGLWQTSFVAAKDVPALDLVYTPPEVKRTPIGVIGNEGETVVMEAAKEVPRLELRWQQQAPTRYAHVTLEVSCENVVMGPNPWQAARIILLWFDGHGKMVEGHLPLWSGYGDETRRTKDVMVPLLREGTLPCLIVENRAASGIFKIHSVSIQPAELRPGFAWMLGGVLLSWVVLIGFAVRRWVVKESVALPRIALTAALWVGFAWVSSFPGPWIPWHPLGKPFEVKHLSGVEISKPKPEPVAPVPAPVVPAPAAAAPAAQAPPVVAEAPPVVATPSVAEAKPPAPKTDVAVTQAPPSVDPVPPERLGGGPVRWFLNHMPGLKRLMHLIAFAGLAAMMAFLTGSGRAAWPAFSLGILSEFFQWAFGFGFDRGDVLDLIFDAVAILAGLVMWKWMRRMFAKRRESEVVTLQSPASNT